jgi:hypothetical protein
VDKGLWRHLLITAITLGGVGAMLWMEMPDWQRETIRRQIRSRMRSLATRAARASGHHAMGDELSGRTTEADAGYAFTHWISRVRDSL